MTDLTPGTRVWWHSPDRPSTPAKSGTVQEVRADGQIAVNPGVDQPTVRVPGMYVHEAERDPRCSFCAAK